MCVNRGDKGSLTGFVKGGLGHFGSKLALALGGMLMINSLIARMSYSSCPINTSAKSRADVLWSN